MKEFIEKLIGRLEELRIDKSNYFGVLNIVAEKYDRANEMLDDAIEIVKELAGEYKDKDCSECSRRKFYQQGYEDAKKEYINTSTDKSIEQSTWQQQTMNRFERVD